MQKVSLRKLSLLGLVLMGASAVTAAVLPAVKEDDKFGTPGSLTASTVGAGVGGVAEGLTCTVDTLVNGLPAIGQACNITAISGTTGATNGSTDGAGNSTGAPDSDGH